MNELTDKPEFAICDEAFCDWLPCLTARRDLAADELRGSHPTEYPAKFAAYVELARAVRRGQAEEARYIEEMNRYAAEPTEVATA